MKTRALTLLKFVAPIVILSYLIWDLATEQPPAPGEPTTLAQLRDQPKDWPALAAALTCALAAVCLSFTRWWLLVRAIHIPFRLRDAFRLGFLGYMLNFVSPGAVGGDLFKAIFLAHERPGRRAEAVATVVVDRLIGLYSLLLVTSAALLTIDLGSAGPQLWALAQVSLAGTVLGGVLLAAALTPAVRGARLVRRIAHLRYVGPTFLRLLAAAGMYRRRPGTLATIGLLSLGVHALFALSLYLAAGALFDPAPTLAEHLVIVPLAMLAGALPFSPMGMGVFELAMNLLYQAVPLASIPNAGSQGLVVALTYRAMTIIIAAVGVVYYWACRREVAEVMSEI